MQINKFTALMYSYLSYHTLLCRPKGTERIDDKKMYNKLGRATSDFLFIAIQLNKSDLSATIRLRKIQDHLYKGKTKKKETDKILDIYKEIIESFNFEHFIDMYGLDKDRFRTTEDDGYYEVFYKNKLIYCGDVPSEQPIKLFMHDLDTNENWFWDYVTQDYIKNRDNLLQILDEMIK